MDKGRSRDDQQLLRNFERQEEPDALFRLLTTNLMFFQNAVRIFNESDEQLRIRRQCCQELLYEFFFI